MVPSSMNETAENILNHASMLYTKANQSNSPKTGNIMELCKSLDKTSCNSMNVSAKTIAAAGIPIALLSLAIVYPDGLNSVLDKTRRATTKVCTNIAQCTNHIFEHGAQMATQAWNNRVNFAKTGSLIGISLGINWLTRRQNSLLSHLYKHGTKGIFPAVLDQCGATMLYTIDLFRPIK